MIVSWGTDPVILIGPLTPFKNLIPFSVNEAESNEELYFSLIGVVMTSEVFRLFAALLILFYYQSNLTLINASFVKSFTRGTDILATASSSLLSLYKPTVVI